jgi:hypothetical protein
MRGLSNEATAANAFTAFAVVVFWFCISSLAFANISYDALSRVDKIGLSPSLTNS